MDPILIHNNEKEAKLTSLKSKCQHHLYSEHFAIATILIITYFIETIVQIYLMINCYGSSCWVEIERNWLWVLFISWIVSSFLVAFVSFVWTLRGLDFSGKFCGQLLCYLMHFCLLGLLWRYLKIALAYEKADVYEFLRLRNLQIYIQAFPLVVLHLVLCFVTPPSSQGYENVAGMVFCELFSSVTSLVLNTQLDYKENNIKKKRQLNVTVTSRILLLISRVIAIVLLVSLTGCWSVVLILIHIVISQLWIFTNFFFERDDEVEEDKEKVCSVKVQKRRNNTLKDLVTCSYVLFWDLNSSTVQSKNIYNLRYLSLPVLLVFVENVTIVIFHLCQTQVTQMTLTILCGTCLLFGWITLAFSTIFMWRGLSTNTNIKTTKDNRTFTQIQGSPSVIHLNNKINKNYKLNQKFTNTIYEINESGKKERSEKSESKPTWTLFQVECCSKKVDESIRRSYPSKISKKLAVQVEDNKRSVVEKSMGICEINPKSPLEIRKAYISIVSKQVVSKETQNDESRCDVVEENECIGGRVSWEKNNVYEKLIEDAYGILICEGEKETGKRKSGDSFRHSTFRNKRIKVLCAKCFENHDPILTDCDPNYFTQNKQVLFIPPNSLTCSETTEYPTDTEFTCCNNDNYQHREDRREDDDINSTVQSIQSVIYANLPKCYFSQMFYNKLEFTGLEYVNAWLMMNEGVDKYCNSLDSHRPTIADALDSSTTTTNFHPPLFYFQPPPKQKQHPIISNAYYIRQQRGGTFIKSIQDDLLETIV